MSFLPVKSVRTAVLLATLCVGAVALAAPTWKKVVPSSGSGSSGSVVTLDTNGYVPLTVLSPRIPLLDGNNKIPAALLPVSSGSISTNINSMAGAACQTITHNYNTFAVGYQVWMTDPSTGAYGPLVPSAQDGTTNLALNRTSTSSSVYNGSYTAPQANNGLITFNATDRWLPCSGCGGGWWQVDLGSAQTITKVRILSGNTDTATSWNVATSMDGSSFAAPVAFGVCVLNGSCNGFVDHVISPTTARYVRVTTISGGASYHGLTEVEVYGGQPAVTLPDANSFKFCNYTGITRNFAIVLWH